LRLQFHNDPLESRKFTARGIPWVLKVSLQCDSKEVAIRLEAFIKKMKSKKFVERLIEDPVFAAEMVKKCET
jgi:putative endonuclease